MKKTTILKLILSCLLIYAPKLKAQSFDSLDWRPGYRAIFDSLIQDSVPSGILIDRALPFGKAKYFTGLVDTVPCSSMYWDELYSEMYDGAFSTQNMRDKNAPFPNIAGHLANDSIPFAMQLFKYSQIKDYALDSNLLGWNADSQLVDLFPRSESPYSNHTLFAAIALQQQVKTGKQYTYYFDPNYFLTNFGSIPSSIEINFGEGSGWHTLSQGAGYTFAYENSGDYTMEIKVIADLIIYSSITKIKVMRPTILPNFSKFISTGITINSGQRALVSGMFGKDANGNPHTCIQKPFIILDGVDFGEKGHADDPDYAASSSAVYNGYYDDINLRCNSTGLVDLLDPYLDKNNKNEQWRNFPTLLTQLQNQGYDVLFLDFFNGADDIRKNADVFIELIKRLYETKELNDGKGSPVSACICEDAVVLGPSMGGQVARYGLTKMEHNNKDHHTRLYISFDSPHKGANIPLGAQKLAYRLENKPMASEAVFRKLNRPAAKQLLILHGTSASNNPKSHAMRGEYVDDLAALGNYPKNCRKIAISNGSKNVKDNKNLTANGDDFLYLNQTNLKLIDIRLNAWALQGKTLAVDGKNVPCLAEIRIPQSKATNLGTVVSKKVHLYEVTPPNLADFDNCPGSVSNQLKSLAGELKEEGEVIGDLVNNHPLFTFIPSISALDINTTDGDVGYDILANAQDFDRPQPSIHPFESYHSPFDQNEAHTEISINYTTNGKLHAGNSEWLLKEIGEQAVAIKPQLPYTSGANSYNTYNFSDPRNATLYDLTISTGAKMYVNRDDKAAYGNGIDPIDASTVKVHSTLCAAVSIGSGAEMILGERAPTNNIGMVYMRPGSILSLQAGSTLTIRNGSRLIIEPGATLTVENGAIINLEGGNSVIEINGKLNLGNGGHYQTSGNGYTLFKKTGHADPMITAGSLSSILFEGSAGEKKLEVGINTRLEFVNTTLEIKNCEVAINYLSQIVTRKKVVISDAWIHSDNGPSNKPHGIKLYSQSDNEVSITNTSFENLITALDFSTNNNLHNLKLDGCTFNQCTNGLITNVLNTLSIDNGVFSNCTAGIYAILGSSSTQCKFTNTNFFQCNTGLDYSGDAALLVSKCNFTNCTSGLVFSPYSISSSPLLTIRCSNFTNSKLNISAAELNMSRNTASNFVIPSAGVAGYYHGGHNIFTNSNILLNEVKNWHLENGRNAFMRMGNWTGLYAEGTINNPTFISSVSYDGNHMNTVYMQNNSWAPITSKQANGNYVNISYSGFLLLNSPGGCSGNSGVDGDGLVPIIINEAEAHKNLEMEVFPNPATEVLNIQIKQGKPQTIALYNLMGQECVAEQLQTISDNIVQLNTTNLAAGCYILQVTDKEGQNVRKQIILSR